MPQKESASACALIRTRTADLHARVESHTGFGNAPLTPRSVLALLSGLAALAGPLLTAVAGGDHGFPIGQLDWPRRHRRLTSYLTDLRRLQQHLDSVPSATAEFPAPTAEPATLTPPELAGWLYVTEGASLGSVLIRRELRRQPWATELPLPSFEGYGPDTGRFWRAFRSTADDWADRSPGRASAMADAAVAAFTLVEERMANVLADPRLQPIA